MLQCHKVVYNERLDQLGIIHTRIPKLVYVSEINETVVSISGIAFVFSAEWKFVGDL